MVQDFYKISTMVVPSSYNSLNKPISQVASEICGQF